MPTYEYRCEHCRHELEMFQNISESPKKKCPRCGKLKLRRKIGGGAGFLFKGSGFYLTDYRSDSYRKAAEAEKPAEPASSASGGGDAKGTPAPEKPKEKSKKGKAKGKETAA
jgi:putative FmdB family regulatory protein